MRGLLGKKIGMTRIFNDSKAIPVTVLEAGPCDVVQIKKSEVDGYSAIQVGFMDKKDKHTTKPLSGHFSKHNVSPKKHLAEFVAVPGFAYKSGQVFNASLFQVGDMISVTGFSKGRGFSGAIKRHNFSTQRKTHGQGDTHRHVGSIGNASDPSRVFPGKKMPGHHGNSKTTVKSLEVVGVDVSRNFIFIKGSVPGPKNGILILSK